MVEITRRPHCQCCCAPVADLGKTHAQPSADTTSQTVVINNFYVATRWRGTAAIGPVALRCACGRDAVTGTVVRTVRRQRIEARYCTGSSTLLCRSDPLSINTFGDARNLNTRYNRKCAARSSDTNTSRLLAKNGVNAPKPVVFTSIKRSVPSGSNDASGHRGWPCAHVAQCTRSRNIERQTRSRNSLRVTVFPLCRALSTARSFSPCFPPAPFSV